MPLMSRRIWLCTSDHCWLQFRIILKRAQWSDNWCQRTCRYYESKYQKKIGLNNLKVIPFKLYMANQSVIQLLSIFKGVLLKVGGPKIYDTFVVSSINNPILLGIPWIKLVVELHDYAHNQLAIQKNYQTIIVSTTIKTNYHKRNSLRPYAKKTQGNRKKKCLQPRIFSSS